MQILVEGPHFSGVYDTGEDRIAYCIRFMKGWSLEDIKDYCNKKGWKVTVIGEPIPQLTQEYWDDT